MRDRMERILSQVNIERKRARRKKLLLSLLSLAVALSTLFSLLLPAFTLQKQTFCGLEEHVHGENCYERSLVCGREEGEGHRHTEGCYTTEAVLICGEEESAEHSHGEECYRFESVLCCGLEEQEAHTHSETCYEDVLICPLTEHSHSKACYADLSAVESEATWMSSFPDFEKESPRERLLAIAASQLGYRESTQNYLVQEDESLKGYTRYGDWYGDPYGDWDAMFVSFCLYYAGIDRNCIPYENNCEDWVDVLQEKGLCAEAWDYSPAEGDLIFFDRDEDSLADGVGLVFRWDEDSGSLKTIEGNCVDRVEQCSYLMSDEHILCYGVLPKELSIREEERLPDTAEDWPAQSFRQELEGLSVSVEAEKGAFPAGTRMEARLVESEQVLDAVSSAVDGKVVWVQAVDISFYAPDGRELQPLIPIRVAISSEQIGEIESESTEVVHVAENGAAQLVEQEDAESAKDSMEIAFETDAFSIYALVGTAMETTVRASDGKTYEIIVSFTAQAGIPEGAELDVSEIIPEMDGDIFGEYASRAAEALGCETAPETAIRLFDIRIVDAAGEKVNILAPVDVRITLADWEDRGDAQTQVVHFADGGESAQVLEHVDVSAPEEGQSGRTLSFETGGFSVYAIVDAPAPVAVQTVQTLEELEENLDREFCLSIKHPPQYFTSTLNGYSAFEVTMDGSAAAKWTLEPAGDGAYYITVQADGQKKYISNPNNGNLAGLSDAPGAAFEISEAPNGSFYLKLRDQNKWLQYSNSGSGIRFWTSNSDPSNPLITFTYSDTMGLEKDPYGLDGKSYGIAYQDNNVLAAALTAESKTVGGKQRLAGKDMVMKPDVLDNDGVLLVAENSDIQEWTFESIQEDQYYITTTVDGQKKFLNIGGNALTLSDEPTDSSVIRAIPGTGANAGKWHFTANGQSLNLLGSAANGFNSASGSGDTTWMNLVKRSELDEEAFTLYSAKKVSVSDELNVYNGQEVVIYTRIWNDTKKRYEFFAVDHNGTLIPCYDTGDNVEWVGSNVNTALWTFTEYRNADGTPSYYYELQNTQYGEYIAPQLTGNQILSDQTIGINLNGRRNGENYSPIIAWDDDQYAYTGLKTENGRVVPCPLAEAEDFYFAIVNPIDEGDKLSTVATVDNNAYGITMRMIDYNNEKDGQATSQRDLVQSTVLTRDSDKAGLLSTDLKENGYPVAENGQSLEILYTATATQPMTTANHLFLQSVYNESGYFEYDSTQNFAHLNADGSFTVYDQLGSIGDYDRPTGNHGQFMPYNDLTPGKYCTFTNQYDVLAKELPDTNPRKGEKLYNIGTRSEVDYHFGMEMTAGFTQTANGLDAWGHDIIFEFSGDDDFWLYVDGELVLDLGGVHSAMTGSVNFRTGEILTSNRGNSTLYETFRRHYQDRGMPEEEINAKLNELFEQKTVDGRQVYAFRDYTKHTMKMFYMERGAGASNLHMRFNLAAVKPGTVVLSKKLSGTESTSNSLIEFPYQIIYTLKSEGGKISHLLEEKTGDTNNVTYKDTVAPVRFKPQMSIGGENYKNVFLLRPGESAVIDLPDDTLNYYIVECGVNTGAYDRVTANGVQLTGIGDGERKDFQIEPDSMENRPQVDYDNHVRDGAMRSMTITKKLYDVDGQTVLEYPVDPTAFTFRLYLGNEFTDADQLPLANLYPYYVKDPNGNYCRWDAGNRRFESLGIQEYDGLSNYLNDLTPAERERIVFRTSMNGSISKIPAGYSVEVRDLIIGTHFKLVERDYEVPKGYELRLSDGYQRTDPGYKVNNGTTPISGTLHVNETPAVLVSNQKGWGLTVKKVWSDKDFMQSHDDIYFAVYLKDADGGPGALLENTVRRMETTASEVYYFFDQEQMGRHQFDEYLIREVQVEPPAGEELIIGEKGRVMNAETVTPIEDGDTMENGGKPYGGEHRDDYEYSVNYTPGEQTTQNENVRTDTVTNSRPGLKLYKTDWSWENLAGAVFTLKDSEGRDVAAETYTSGEDGLITIAYLSHGTYTLSEIGTPKGYVGLITPMTITVSEDGSISASGPDESLYRIAQAAESDMAAITIRNRRNELHVLKVDSGNDSPLAGVHFALYWQVTDKDGNKIKDNQPIAGFEDLVTDENGCLERLDLENLRAGTYYLTETEPLDGYEKLEEDLCFTIGEDGSVRINSSGHESWLSVTTDAQQGKTSFLITIPNGQLTKVSFRKVDSADHERNLKDAVFDLYEARDNTPAEPALLSGLVSGEDGLLRKDGKDIFALPPGDYQLVETQAPPGYQIKKDPVTICVSVDGDSCSVSYYDGSNLSASTGLSYRETDRVYTLMISNTTGYELPASGGFGTAAYTLGGAGLILIGLLYRFRRRRREGGCASP